MANHGAGAMSWIESGPSGAGQECLDPCVTRQLSRHGAGGMARVGGEIAGNVAGRNSGQAEQTYAQVREILAYSATRGEYIVNGGMYVGGAAIVAELIAQIRNHAFGVRGDVFG